MKNKKFDDLNLSNFKLGKLEPEELLNLGGGEIG
jgi:hypothetical protein